MPKTKLKPIGQIRKRDGRIVNFDSERIIIAIDKAFIQVGEKTNGFSKTISLQVESDLARLKKYLEIKILSLRLKLFKI